MVVVVEEGILTLIVNTTTTINTNLTLTLIHFSGNSWLASQA